MEEAASYQHPKELRHLFTVIMMHCEVVAPADLFYAFQESMMEDFLEEVAVSGVRPAEGTTGTYFSVFATNKNFSWDWEKCNDQLLWALSDLLYEENTTLEKCYLPTPSSDRPDEHTRLLIEATNYDKDELWSRLRENMTKLTSDQIEIFRDIYHTMENDEAGVFFIQAPGGTGIFCCQIFCNISQ